jgi:ribosomal protein S2
MRFLPGEVTNAIETSLARVYDVDADELAELLFPED